MWSKEAEKIVVNRQRDYDHPLANFLRIGLSWSAKDKFTNPVEVAEMMILTKIARSTGNHKADNYIDIIGYVLCIQQMGGFVLDHFALFKTRFDATINTHDDAIMFLRSLDFGTASDLLAMVEYTLFEELSSYGELQNKET